MGLTLFRAPKLGSHLICLLSFYLHIHFITKALLMLSPKYILSLPTSLLVLLSPASGEVTIAARLDN